jgi:hypothetical protein
MAEKDTETGDLQSLRSLTDDEIVTERKLPRRSFLGTTGVVLAGAAGIVSGMKASGLHSAPQDDPNKRPADPDKKPEDPDKRPDDAHKKPEDRRKKEDKKADDAHKRSTDPDRRPADPDKRPEDPHRL